MKIRYIRLYPSVSKKLPIIKSAFPFLIEGLAVFPGRGLVISLTVRAGC